MISAISQDDAAIAETVRRAEDELSEADALYARAGLLEASALMMELFRPDEAARQRERAQTCRETAKALAHSALQRQLAGSVR